MIDAAFEKIRKAFPETATFQGIHFKYAVADGVLIESCKSILNPITQCQTCGQTVGERERRFYYWLLVGTKFWLVHASMKSKLKPLQTIGDSLKVHE